MGSEQQQGDWDREQMDINPADGAAPPDDAPQWQKEGVAAEGLPEPHAPQGPSDSQGQGDSELSGHGKNPGGGERFANSER